MVGVWGRLPSSCVSGICKWWILVFSTQFDYSNSSLICEKCTCNILVVTCCFVGHWMLWCPHSCVSLCVWGIYFWKETQVHFWQKLNFDYTTLRNKWMHEECRNYLIYCTQLTDLSLQQLYPVTEVYIMHIHSWLISFHSVVACPWSYTHDVYFETVVFVVYRNGRIVLFLIITYFAYFCNGKDRLVKFHFAVGRIILCAEQHTTVWNSCHFVITGVKSSSGCNWMCELWACAAD